jgi:hypothetical protein
MSSRKGRRNAVKPDVAATVKPKLSISARNSDRILLWARNFITGRPSEEISLCGYIFAGHDGGEGGGSTLSLPDAPPGDLQPLIQTLMSNDILIESETVLSKEVRSPSVG